MADDLANLSPEERLQRLKQKKKEKEEELKKAKALIEDTQAELKDKKEFLEKVPIPQVAVESTEGLSEEEKEIVRTQKGLNGQNSSEESLEEKARSEDEDTLEEAIRREHRQTQELDPMTQAYIQEKSKEPMVQLYQEMQSLYGEAKQAGYMNPEVQQRFAQVSSAIEQKVQDVNEGSYTLTAAANEAKRAANAMRRSLGSMYESAKAQSDHTNWYAQKKEDDKKKGMYQ